MAHYTSMEEFYRGVVDSARDTIPLQHRLFFTQRSTKKGRDKSKKNSFCVDFVDPRRNRSQLFHENFHLKKLVIVNLRRYLNSKYNQRIKEHTG